MSKAWTVIYWTGPGIYNVYRQGRATVYHKGGPTEYDDEYLGQPRIPYVTESHLWMYDTVVVVLPDGRPQYYDGQQLWRLLCSSPFGEGIRALVKAAYQRTDE